MQVQALFDEMTAANLRCGNTSALLQGSFGSLCCSSDCHGLSVLPSIRSHLLWVSWRVAASASST